MADVSKAAPLLRASAAATPPASNERTDVTRGGGSEDLGCDLCIIGAGSGGLSLAAAAAQMGVNVILIEKHKMGGDCLNYGCVPSKAMIAAARRAHIMRSSAAVRHPSGCRRPSTRTPCTTTSKA